MKQLKITLFVILFILSGTARLIAQADTAKLYHPDADAAHDFSMAVRKAKVEGKQVLLQIGGNWCKWCIRFDKFCRQDSTIDSLLKAGFVTLHINTSKENRNLPFLATLGYPQRFGFPVFVIADSSGMRLHTQNSWYLEDGKESYDAGKVISFLKDWSAAALRPENYSGKE